MDKKTSKNGEGNRLVKKEIEKHKKRKAKREKISTMPFMFFKNYRILKTISNSQAFSIAIVEHMSSEAISCHCGCNDCFHYDSFERTIKHCSKNGGLYELRVKAKRYKCRHCGSVFREKLTAVMPYKRQSQPYERRITDDYNCNISNKDISKRLFVSESTVERAIHKEYKKKVKETLSYECPKYIGIDEHTIHKGYDFATSICDLRKHRIYDMVEGKSASKIEGYLMSLKGRLKVKAVCIDLSSSYRSIVKRVFPNAKIVADRFHVISLAIRQYMEFCKKVQEQIRWKKPITNCLRTHNENLKTHQIVQLNEFLEANPAIAIVYEVKEKLCKLLNKKRQNAKQCKENIRVFQELIRQMKESQLEDFLTLAKTLESWAEEIVRMWIFTKNNGILEGFHCKMKLIQRRAYGYRNFENYRLRVLIQCNLVKDADNPKPPKPKIKTKKMKSKIPPQNHLKAA